MLRPATAADRPLLTRLVAHAVDWRPGTAVRSEAAVLADPHLARYVAGWPGRSEQGLVTGTGTGGAWWRCWSGDEHGYGFVAADVPEVTVAVLPAHRGAGMGTALLRGLVAGARAAGLPGLSLSVEPDNPAGRLYERLGFQPVGDCDGSVTMLLRLGAQEGPEAARRCP